MPQTKITTLAGKKELSPVALQKIAIDLEEQNKLLTIQRDELQKKLNHAVNNKPLEQRVQEKILELRDDAGYYQRRLEEANLALTKYLNQLGLQNLTITIEDKKL